MTARYLVGRRFALPVAALLVALLPRAALGDFQPTTLANLEMNGLAVQVGPLIFSDFAYRPTGPDMPLAAAVTVSPVNRGDRGEFGLLFTSTWTNLTNNGRIQDALIQYTVTTTGPDIADAELFVIPIAVVGTAGQDDGFASVSEGLLIVPAGQIPTLMASAVVDNANNIRSVQLGDSLTFPKRQDVPLVATQLTLVNEGGTPIVGSVEETFSVVPEPGACALLLSGLAALVGFSLCPYRKRPLKFS
jgi:hypothetical protein